jgi:glycine/D-amino acid oxidase-like deaminating enzyme
VAVVGAGVFGLAAALELAERGHRVTIFEQGRVPNERASSTDVAKTIRRLYGTLTVYVELAERAAVQWQRWQERLAAPIYYPVGHLSIIRRFEPGTRTYDGVELLRERGAPIEIWTAEQARVRFPQFAYLDGDVCVFDPGAGFIAAARALAGLAQLAAGAGVTLHEESPVLAVHDTASGVRLETAGGGSGGGRTFDRVVVTAGAWMERLVPTVGRWITATRQQMVFFTPADPAAYAPGVMPAWGDDPEETGWYGHPLLAEGFVKVANDLLGERVDPDTHREAHPEFVERTRAFVAQRIPGLARATVAGSRSCLYESTPDRDFIVDWAPESSRVLVAGGGSGHGFKFGGSIGPLIADALEDRENPLGAPFRLGDRFTAEIPPRPHP